MFLSLFFLFFLFVVVVVVVVVLVFFSIISKSKRYSTCFAVVRVGCSAVFFAVFSKVSEVVLIFFEVSLANMTKAILITTSESCVVVRFVGNRHCNSPQHGN